MDASKYQDVTVSQGHKYHFYYTAPATVEKPHLLFLHGFPSSSWDWHHQVDFLGKKGYGIIVPDLLGYGGTDTATALESYTPGTMARDLTDILDAIKVQKVVVVSHDWGSGLASGLVTRHPDRVLGAAFFALGYMPPSPSFSYVQARAFYQQTFKADVLGYWEYFAQEDGPAVVEKNLDAMYSAMFTNPGPADEPSKVTLRQFIELGLHAPLASWITEEEIAEHKKQLLRGGLQGPLNWYKVRLSSLTAESDAAVPIEAYHLHFPVFFGAALRDKVCLPAVAKPAFDKYAKNTTIVDFDTGHWVMLEKPDEVNEALEAWVAQF